MGEPVERRKGWCSRGIKALVPLVVLAAAIYVSVDIGRPSQLPGAALGSVLLLYVERAGAGLAAVGVVWLIGWHALHGRFPIKFGNIEYAEEVEASSEAVDALKERVKLLEDIVLPDPGGKGVESEEP